MTSNKFDVVRGLLPYGVLVSLSPCEPRDMPMIDVVVFYKLDLIELKGGKVVFVYFSPLSETFGEWMHKRRMAIAELKENSDGA